jgi:hypothetical protein
MDHPALPPIGDEGPPSPPRLQRSVAQNMRLHAEDIKDILMKDLSEESVRSVLPDIRALSPSQRTHLMNDLKSSKIIPPRVNEMLGKLTKRRKVKKGVSRRNRTRA